MHASATAKAAIMKEIDFTKAIALNDYITATRPAKMRWFWGEALYGYSLSLMDAYRGEEKYTDFLKGFCDYYVEHAPVIHSSDTSAPALITYAMYKKTGNEGYKHLTDRVLDYIQNEPRLIDGCVNHMGGSAIGKFYPRSIWVDSIMMFGLFPALYAVETGDSALVDTTVAQIQVFAKYLMDENDHLWYHSYWVDHATHYPRKKIFWGRGNGWVVSALPMIIEKVGDHEGRARLIEIFQQTCEAILPYQLADGTWETVFNKVGRTYKELTATALIASGFLSGYRQGFLDEHYYEAGLKAYEACIQGVKQKGKKVTFTQNSGPTIPVPLIPYIGYAWVPITNNSTYGMAGLNFATIEYLRAKEAQEGVCK